MLLLKCQFEKQKHFKVNQRHKNRYPNGPNLLKQFELQMGRKQIDKRSLKSDIPKNEKQCDVFKSKCIFLKFTEKKDLKISNKCHDKSGSYSILRIIE